VQESTQIQKLHQELAQASQLFEEKIRDLSMARRIGDSLKYARDARRVFETIIDTILEETSAENCSLMLLDHETGELTVRAARGQADSTVSYYRVADSSRRGFRLGEGVAGWVAQQGQPISIPDVSRDNRFVASPQPIGFIGSLLCQPLTVEDRVVGVVNLSHPRPHVFTAEDERLMAVIADQVAVALNSVQIFEEMQQLNASLRAEIDRATEELRKANQELRRAYDEVDRRVQERTAELAKANEVLKEQIAERERMEEALRESNRRLEEALAELRRTQQHVIQQERLRALGQMASGIAHDFNNALSPILGFSELLLISPESLGDREKATHYLQSIHTAAQDAAGVVKRLSEFYRRRDEREALLPVKLNPLVEQVVSLTQPKWREQALANGITVDVKADLQEVPLISGDEVGLREALTNLIFNAVDAMPHDGTITLRTRPDGDRVVLEVSDTGAGMTEEVRQRCLEPFFTTKGERGTGMGLAMVYGIVQRHRGEIDIQSEPGRGTTFTLRLPVRAEQGAEKGPQAAEVRLRPLRVLIVDDDPVISELIAEYLAGDGHTAERAASGREGLEKFRGGGFDLVVTDRAMPEMSGDQMAAAAKRIAPDVPVLMLTGFGDMMQVSGEKPKDVDFILGKPVTHARLREVLAKVDAKGEKG
jgi:signal transduction histidine kinase